MQNNKLTPWFPPDVKPVRKGIYEIKTPFGQRYSTWLGNKWSYWSADLDKAKGMSGIGDHGLNRYHWRGLAEKP